MKMEIKIRKAEEKDAPKIADMLLSIGELHHNGRPDIYRDSLQKYNEKDIIEILKDSEAPIYVAADENDSVVGYAFCQIKNVSSSTAFADRKFVYIDDFCVDEKYRKQHIGKKLLNTVTEEARKMGVGSVELNVWEFNENAVRFYESCGFKTQRREMEIVF